MKTIASDVALQTVLYSVNPLTKLEIRDLDGSMINKSTILFEGLHQDAYTMENYRKLMLSQVATIKPLENVLVIELCTELDEY